MRLRERVKSPLPLGGEDDADDSLVLTVVNPSNEPRALCSIDELHGAVVSQKQMSSHVAHARRRAVASNGEKELMLGRGHARVVCLFFAPVQEPSQAVSEAKQPFKVAVGELLAAFRSLHILSR